jgi:DNA anti-recombination protein RmuC
MEIWQTKLETKEQRHKEIITSVLKDFYDLNKDLTETYEALGSHIKRVRKSYQKYGKS